MRKDSGVRFSDAGSVGVRGGGRVCGVVVWCC
jgi:hypothetical protein